MAAMSHDDRLDHQLDAERGVIGSLLIDESLVREMVSVVDAQDFLNPANRLIFQAARQLFRDGKPVDAMTIRDRVGSQYSDYMTQLMEITPTSANWREYAALMHSQATTQRIKNLAQSILENAVTLDDCRQPCADMAQLLADGRRIDAWTMREMMEDFFRAQDPDAPLPEYVTYGLDVLDQRNYTELGDVVMIGGYPSDGKTALALMISADAELLHGGHDARRGGPADPECHPENAGGGERMRIVCERAGRSITFAHTRPYWLQSVEGVGEADFDVSSEKASGMDGEIYKGATANKRNIVIKATVIPPAGTTHDQIREEFFALFVPRETGTLTFYDGEKVRVIDYKTENCEFDLDGQFRDVTVSLICPDPVFKAAQDERTEVAEIEGLIEWPLELSNPFEVSLKHDTLMATIQNSSSTLSIVNGCMLESCWRANSVILEVGMLVST